MGWGIGNIFKGTVNAVVSVVRSIVNVIVSVVKAIVNAIVAVVKWIVSAVKAIWNWFSDLLSDFGKWIVAIIIIIILIIISYYTGYGWEYISAVLEWVMGAENLLAVTSWLDTAATIYELAGFWETVVWVGGQIGGWIVAAYKAVGAWIGVAWTALSGWLGSAASTVWEAASAVGAGIGSAVKWAAGLISDNPGLAALGLAAATGVLDWLADNWQLVALGVGAFYLLKDKEGGGGRATIVNQLPSEDRHAFGT